MDFALTFRRRSLVFRLATAAVGIPVLALVVWIGSPWLSLFVGGFAALGAVEFCRMARRRDRRPDVLVAVVWSLALLTAGHALSDDLTGERTLQVVVGAAAFSYLVWQVRFARSHVGLSDWAVTAAAALYTGGLLAHAPLLRGLEQGREWVFLAVAVTFAADTSAFLVGRSLGRRPLAPKVSPGKTWEGAVGGFLAAIGATAALVFLLDLDVTLWVALPLGALIGIVGQLGDLVESQLKRTADVKDSGWLIPGHGGVLDRLDSIVFNLALVYYFVVWGVQ